MRKAVLSSVCGVGSLLGLAAQADVVVPIDTRLPEPGIAALEIDADGTIVGVEFTDGSTLSAPVEVTPADLKSIDLLEFYHIPIDLLVLKPLDESADGYLEVRASCHVGSTFYRNCAEVVRLDKLGLPTGGYDGNLETTSIDNVELVDHRALRLIEYRDHGSPEVKRAILRD